MTIKMMMTMTFLNVQYEHVLILLELAEHCYYELIMNLFMKLKSMHVQMCGELYPQ